MSSLRYYVVEFEPSGLRVAVTEGTRLLEAARRAGLHLWAGCGGQGICRQCRVIVLEGQVSEVTEDEIENLTTDELRSNHRQACSVRIYSAVKVRVPEHSVAAQPRCNSQ